jgi:predicted MPP superfamily phosphohydrolase
MSRNLSFLIFFSVVLLIYGSVNYYIFIRGYQALKLLPALKAWYTGLFIFIASSYIIARIVERFYLCVFTDALTWIGSFWLAAMLYFFLFVVVLDGVRVVIWLLPGINKDIIAQIPHVKQGLLLFSVLAVVIVPGVGYYRATRPIMVTLDLNIPARQANPGTIKIAMVSDIHLGTLVAGNRLRRLVSKINDNDPDIILLAGDIVDEDLAPVIRQNLGLTLEQLKAPLGVWAITGNHEYIGGAGPAIAYLEKHGIRFLRDTVHKIDGAFWLAGRDDRDGVRFGGSKRKKLKEILSLTDSTLPVVLLDHQPFSLDSVAQSGVDLQLSGHTHHGQLWPLNYLTSAIYEVSHGYLKKRDTHIYVSSGYGTWGPPVRLGPRSEFVMVNLQLNP